MNGSAITRKPLGIRATPAQHRVLTEAAAREQRSLNSFVLRAALRAAESQPQVKPKRSPEEVMAIFRAAREEFASLNPGRDPLEEFLAERRAEAERE